MKMPKYTVGDVVGVCSDRMYEFEITQVQKKPLMYGGKCINVAADKGDTTACSVGEEYAIRPEQIVLKLGENAAEWLETKKKIEEVVKADRKRRQAAKKAKKKGK